MEYIINDYSLCGQFDNTEAFLDSLRSNTLPVLKKIRDDLDSLIWNQANLYNLQVCPGITLSKVKPKRNIKDPTLSRFKSYISSLYKECPHWSEQEDIDILPVSYSFDKTKSNNFPMTNCFTKALQLELCIISFEHK